MVASRWILLEVLAVQCVVADPVGTIIEQQDPMTASLETLETCAGAPMVHQAEEEDLEDQEDRQDSQTMLAWAHLLSAQEKLCKEGV